MSLAALAFLAGFLAIVGSIVFLVLRSLELWRTFRGFTRALGGEVASFTDSLEQLAAFEPPDVDRVSVAFARMRASQQRLDVLTGALGRVRGQWTGLLAFAPKK